MQSIYLTDRLFLTSARRGAVLFLLIDEDDNAIEDAENPGTVWVTTEPPKEGE